MNMLRRVYYFFSRYVGPSERRVDKFFGRVSEKSTPRRIEASLGKLVQADIAVINLWTEYRYKGYDYLNKRTRKQLYENLGAIKQDFASFAATQTVDVGQLMTHIESKGIETTQLRAYQDQLVHLATIMRYLSPAQGRYVYRPSSSFGRLLRNPAQEVLEGDCNQIVTLYIALYAQTYDVSDLQLTLFPGHVALHMHGVDIEATNGTFTRYDKPASTTAPLHEIVSVNLLDTTDLHFTKTAIHPEIFLQSARLAYVVSGNRSLVKQNLEVAYHNAVRHMMKQQSYGPALAYAKQSKNYELIQLAARNGAVHAMGQQDFAGARRFAADAQDKAGLLRTIDRQEAGHLYKTKQYTAAIKLYERLGDREWVGHSYRGLYVQEQAKLGRVKTVQDIQAQARTIRTMELYAKRSGDPSLLRHVKSLTKHL